MSGKLICIKVELSFNRHITHFILISLLHTHECYHLRIVDPF